MGSSAMATHRSCSPSGKPKSAVSAGGAPGWGEVRTTKWRPSPRSGARYHAPAGTSVPAERTKGLSADHDRCPPPPKVASTRATHQIPGPRGGRVEQSACHSLSAAFQRSSKGKSPPGPRSCACTALGGAPPSKATSR